MMARTKVFEERFLPRRLESAADHVPMRLEFGEIRVRSLGREPTTAPDGARRWHYEWVAGKTSGTATVDLCAHSDAWSEVVLAVEGPGRKRTTRIAKLLIDGVAAALTNDLPATTLRIAASDARDLIPRFRASA